MNSCLNTTGASKWADPLHVRTVNLLGRDNSLEQEITEKAEA